MEEPVKDNAGGPLITNDDVITYGHPKVSKNVVFGIGDMPAGRTNNIVSKSALKNKQKLADRHSSKPSQIPRYRYHQKEPPILEIPTKSITEYGIKIEKPRHLRSDMQSESSSAIITKVLLEEIRGRHKIGSDRLNEWLMESATDYLRPIANCLGASNISSTMVPQTSQSECDVNTRMSIEKRLIEALSNKNHNAIIALDKNMPYITFEDLDLDMRPEQDLSNNDHLKGDHLTEKENNDLSGTTYDGNEHMPTTSYIDCPSEILQRMTNLEAEGYDIASTVSGTDIEIRDDFLSNYNFEQAYSSLMEGRSENWILDNCNDSLCCIEEPHPEEPNICKLCASHTETKKQQKGACDSHDYQHHYCWRREVAKRCSDRSVRYRGRCKKCHKHRNNQIRIPRPFITFTKHFSVGRICRRRWNLMWKGTAERWASKPKSHSKCRTFATMLDLQRSGFWENADVQTTVLLYHEAGTDAIAKEQKSTGIVPPTKLYSEAYTKIESDKSICKNQSPKHQSQVGPSAGIHIKNTKNNSLEEPITSYPPFNTIKSYKNDISTCIDPIEDYNNATTVITLKEKGNNKNTDLTNSTKYRSQVDRSIETDGSLLLITKKRSSVSINSDIAMVVNLNAHEAFNQTDELEQADTEANINYNNSLEISCDDSSLFSYDVDFYKPHAVETESGEYGYPQSKHTIRMVKPKVSRRRPSNGGLEEVTSHHNIGVITSNNMMTPARGNKNTNRNIVYTSDKSGDTLSSDIRSCDYSKLLMSSSADTEDQDDDDKDVSTEAMAQFNDLTKETSRYLCSRQYDTNAHGTYTGSSFFIEATDRDTNTNICDIYIDAVI
ncbi:PREDICTED: uncharacterized protein LOC106125052 [Papilio xuthus]|uniref:Uncharacterized protein LOC106125052 n=1 Tax=Papilio xuthus TaxID=66420 RepID=A0AAJ6ZR33_PAPXU|nr:PREDICTED: uncharacterized protein LOC106125052 [Papilio xuthus]